MRQRLEPFGRLTTVYMKYLTKGLCFAAFIICMASCAGEDGFEGHSSEQGGIVLTLSADGKVMRQTRADDGVSPIVPGASDFGISLEKNDGSYSKSWNNLDLFNRETSFAIGDYDLTANYGDPNREGFESPHYTGKTQVHVSPGATTEANVVATLANAMVSIRYTDAFKSNFIAYSAAVQTEGHEWVVYAQDETRPAYIMPSDVKLNLTLTNAEGKRVTIQPADFKAEARHHYVVTIGVTENTADLALDIQFDDEVVSETVNVSLSDDLFNAPAPVVTPKGFDPSAEASTYEYADYSGDAQFDIIAFGGIKNVTLNVVSDNDHTPSFGLSAELANASDVLQTQLKTEGVECGGLFRNVDKMAAVNIKKFLSNLPAGKYSIEIQAVDLMTRTTEPVKFNIEIQPILTSLAAVGNADFLGTEVSVDLSTNCEGIKDNVTFRAPNAAGQMVNAHVKSVTAVKTPSGVRTRADLPYTFRYVVEMEQITRSSFNIEATVGRKASEQIAITVADPSYSVVTDPFARKAVFRIDADNEAMVKYICDNVQIYNGGTAVPTSNISHSATGYITVAGLNPSTSYNVFTFKVGGFDKTVPAFTTEAETQVPNGDFNATGFHLNIGSLNVGGQYSVWPVDYQLTSSIDIYEPEGWATVNPITANSSASNKNTWFIVPSTFMSNGKVIVRTVGYNHNGTTPGKSGGAFNIKYYCENAPSQNQLDKAAGELFLGSYPQGGTRVDGISFNSRPTSVYFDYEYTTINGESGFAYARVYSSDKTLIASGNVSINAGSGSGKINLTYGINNFGKRADRIEIGFKSTASSNPQVNIPNGSALDEGQGLGNKVIGANNYHAFAKGSELTIDNVSLGYGTAVARSVRKVGKR